MHTKIYSLTSLLFLPVLLLFSSCKKDENTPKANESELKQQIVNQYADIAYYTYLDSYNKALDLKVAAENFLNAPDNNKFEALRAAWKTSRIPYDHTEAFRFYGGPIDNANGPEGLLNSWPLDEKYIDYVEGDTASGIINNPAFTDLTTAFVESENQKDGGETNVSAGYHAIEFLLWGQDLNENGPGQRSYTDYTTRSNALKRAHYLKSTIQSVVNNLDYLVKAWSKDGGPNYRSEFTKPANLDQSIAKIFRGIGTFSKGEFSGERMQVAYNTREQEDEHSCFSDFTTTEFNYWQSGIEGVYYGKYTRTDGTVISGKGVADLIKYKNETNYNKISSAIVSAKEAVAAIPSPFDQAIKDESARPKIKSAIEKLQFQSDIITEAAGNLGYVITTEL